MDAKTILNHLTYYERLPEAAIREAGQRRAEMLPLFLESIEAFLATDEPSESQNNQLLLIFHILGSWRETAAYRTVARLLASDPARLNGALGDARTESAPGVMLNLFDGDPQPIYDIIECESADEFVRFGMFQVIATLAERGSLSRDSVAKYLESAYTTLQPQDFNEVWSGWQAAIALLGLEDLKPLVKVTHDRGLEGSLSDWDEFLADLDAVKTNPDDPRLDDLRIEPFGDTIEELSKWYGFSEEYFARRKGREGEGGLSDEESNELAELDDDLFYPSEPVINPYRHVGRNDPCLCGSGKKFKKCCLGKEPDMELTE